MDMTYAASAIEKRLDWLRNANQVETIVVTMPTLPISYIAVRNEYFQNYICRNVIIIHGFYIAEVINGMCSRKPLGCDVPTGYLIEGFDIIKERAQEASGE